MYHNACGQVVDTLQISRQFVDKYPANSSAFTVVGAFMTIYIQGIDEN
jgi:hypothetical protein